MKVWVVNYSVCENREYSDINENTICFESEKEAKDFYEDLPKYIENWYKGKYILVNRYLPLEYGYVYRYDRENLQLEEI